MNWGTCNPIPESYYDGLLSVCDTTTETATQPYRYPAAARMHRIRSSEVKMMLSRAFNRGARRREVPSDSIDFLGIRNDFRRLLKSLK